MQTTHTELLFYTDPYLSETDAAVTAVARNDNGHLVVELDRTIFYPEGGGQPADQGTIGEAIVLDVQKTAESRVLHTLQDGEHDFAPGTAVRLQLDYKHRFEYMQQHTGQHLLSASLKHVANANTVSVRQGEDLTTIEVDQDSIAPNLLEGVMRFANERIQRNLPVTGEWVDHSEIDQSQLRRPTSITGWVRLVKIQQTDCVACAGVHTGSTGELAVVRLCRIEKIRGNLRLGFLIGGRAVDEYLYLGSMADDLMQRFSTPVRELHDRILQQGQQLYELRTELDSQRAALAERLTREITAAGRGQVVSDPVLFSLTAARLGEHACGSYLLLCPDSQAGHTRWAIIHDGQRSEIAQYLDTAFGRQWKGGGKPPLFQGVIAGRVVEDEEAEVEFQRFSAVLLADSGN